MPVCLRLSGRQEANGEREAGAVKPGFPGALQGGGESPGSFSPGQGFGAGGMVCCSLTQEKPKAPFPEGFSLPQISCAHPTAGTLVGREHPWDPRPARGTPWPPANQSRKQHRRCLDWRRKKKTNNLIHDVGFKAVGGFWCP